jgi:hypothetical protein
MPAMFNLSLGGLCPKPAITFDGKIVAPATEAAAVPINFLRDKVLICLFSKERAKYKKYQALPTVLRFCKNIK